MKIHGIQHDYLYCTFNCGMAFGFVLLLFFTRQKKKHNHRAEDDIWKKMYSVYEQALLLQVHMDNRIFGRALYHNM